MCGIAGGIGKVDAAAGIGALRHRGPDAGRVETVGGVRLGHTRLAIVDLDPRSCQPFRFGKTTIAFNGEIWNWKAVRKALEKKGRKFITAGDTELVAAALDEWGPAALPRLNGMFAVAWTSDGEMLYLARDRYGEVPVHYSPGPPFRFASERKALLAMGTDPATVADLGPGRRLEVGAAGGVKEFRWHEQSADPAPVDREEAAPRLRELLRGSAADRAMSDVPVCTLLSGGIDSAAVAYLLRESVPDLTAYVAVLDERSADVRAARRVADELDIDLIEVRVPVPTKADLARVVRQIEMPYKAQVEIGWPCLLLAGAMRSDGFKVTFSGEGSDELWASYGFAFHGLKKAGWHEYRKNLFLEQARKNFPRCNKAFMAGGVECRLPFLHPSVVDFALSLPREAVQDGKGRPKAVIQDAFAGLLPDLVTRRAKVAFQDGMGLKVAIAASVPDAKRFYAAEYARAYGPAAARSGKARAD